MLVAAYIVSALAELFGIGLVVSDVRDDRRRTLALTQEYVAVHGGTRTNRPSSQEIERRLRALEVNSERGDEVIRRVLLDMLSVKLGRRLVGPGLITFGVIIGVAANVAAST